MGVGSGSVSSRERGVRERAERARRERRRRLWVRVVAPVTVVVLVVAGLVVARLVRDDRTPASAGTGSVSAADATARLAALPATGFDAVGAGSGVTPATAVQGDALTADGKPRVLYVGAEYCPFCASQRWAVAVALSRFGTFDGLSLTRSATADIHPDTATVSFHGATYTSDLLSFSGFELQTNQPAPGGGYTALDTLSAADEVLLRRYDPQGSIPFLDIGNRFVTIGSSYDPSVLAGMDHQQVVEALADPTSSVAAGALGAANMLTAAMCTTTGQRPQAVCSSPGVTVAAAAAGIS